MCRVSHLLVLLSLLASQAGQLACARVVESCAPSTGPDDKRSIQAARVSALSSFARANGVRLVSGNESLNSGTLNQQVVASSTAAVTRSRVIKAEFKPSTSGPGQMCVSVEVETD